MSKTENWDHSWPLDKKLDYMSKLERDWDSYGSPPISPMAIELARKILTNEDTDKYYVVSPMGGGGVFIEWKAENFKIFAEIDEDGEMFVGAGPVGGESVYFNIPGGCFVS